MRTLPTLPLRHLLPLSAGLMLALGSITPPATAQSLPPGVLKVHSRSVSAKTSHEFGTAVSVSDSYLLVGEPNDDDRAADAGAAYLYLATTGRFVRKLTALDASAGAQFGYAVAVSGTQAIIGARSADGGIGAAYVFDLRRGTQLAKLSPSDGVSGDGFGSAVALSGNLAMVGSPAHNGSRGAAYLFNARTGGAELGKLTATPTTAGDEFGVAVALSGPFALVGAQNASTNKGAAFLYNVSDAFFPNPELNRLSMMIASDGMADDRFGIAVALDGWRCLIGAKDHNGERGAAYLFDGRNGIQLGKLTAPDAAVNDHFGSAVALNGNLAVIGAPEKDAVYVMNTETGGQLIRLNPDDAVGTSFGYALAMAGNRVLVGAPQDADLATDAGAAYLFRPVSGPLPLTQVAKAGDYAPGAVEANFSGFYSAYLNDDGEASLSALLTNRGRGVWTRLPALFRPALKTGDDLAAIGLPGATPSSFGEIIPEDDNGLLMQTFLRGTGITKANNLAWLRSDGTAINTILQHGAAFPELTGSPTFASFPEVVFHDQSGITAATYTLARSAVTGVTTLNDTGVTLRDENGAVVAVAGNPATKHREGDPAPTTVLGDTYSQFFGRVAIAADNDWFYFPAYYYDTVDAITLHGLFFANSATNTEGHVALVGNFLFSGNASFRAFLGEAVSGSNAVFRATMTGLDDQALPITSANDEAIFDESSLEPYLREGQEIDPNGLPGVVVSRFFGYWGVDSGAAAICLVSLRGPGVNASNDLAVIRCSSPAVGASPLILLREGDTVGTDDAARVSVIQRVDVDSVNGHYYILAGLASAAARNQALFRGKAQGLGNDTDTRGRHLPGMVLRKGQGYQQPTGETSAIKTISMPVSTDRTGAGAKGHGQAINRNSSLVITLEFVNRAREIWSGLP